MLKKLLLLATAATVAFLTGTSARADYSNTVASYHPIGYWPLNETVAPGAGITAATNIGSLGTAFNATLQGNVTLGVASSLASDSDKSAGFDGATAMAKTPYTPAALSNNASFTIEAWLLSHEPSAGTQCALSDVDANNPRSGWLLYMDGNNPGQYNFRTYNQNGTAASLNLNIGASGSINADQWYHVAIVVSNGVTATNVYAYINGALAAGPVAFGSFVPNDGAQAGFVIGARSDASFFFNGSVDEVAYYTSALDAATVLGHYSAGTNASPVTPYKTLVQASNPILYFRLGEPNNLPLAHNYGTLGAGVNGYYQAGTVPGVAGPSFSGLATGFGANNYACQFSPGGTESSTTPGPGVACAPYSMALLNDQVTISMSAWIKVPATAVGWFTGVMGRGDASYRFGLDQSGLPRFADGGGGNGDVTGSTPVNDGKWHLWTGVYNAANSNAALYIDTTVAGTDTWNPPGGTGSREFFIGGAPDYGNRNFVGTIAQVAVFTNALGASDVQQLYYSAAPSQFAQAVVGLGPVAYWPLTETNQPPAPASPVQAANLGTLGVSMNGTLNNNIVYGVPGALASTTDTADSFNGFNTRATVPYTSDLGNAPSFTVEAWLLAHDDGSGFGTTCPLSCVNAGATRSGWLIYMDIDNVGQYTFRTYNQNGGNTSLNLDIGAAGSIQMEKWYHIAVVVSNAVTVTNVYGYINGALVAGPTPLPSYVPNDGAGGGFSIGGRTDGDGFDFVGAMDEVAYYTNALSGAQVLAHYQAGTNPTPVTAYSQLVQQRNPILYYRLDEVPTPYGGPDLVPLPIAKNYGSFGTNADGYYQAGTFPGVAGPTNVGFGPNSYACSFSPGASLPSGSQNGPGVICAPYHQAGLNFFQGVTLSAWVQVDNIPAWFQSVLGRGDNSYRMDIDPGAGGGFPHFAAAPNGDVVGTQYLFDGLWHLWTGVYDPVSSASYLYIDGILVASAPGSPLTQVTSYFMIGGVPDYNDRNFSGNICQVAVFSNALSQAQIQNLYNSIGAAPNAVLPTNQFSLNEGANGGITAAVSGTPPLTMQWYAIVGGVTNPVTGQTTPTLTLNNVQASQNGNQYFVVVNNAYGTATSAIATLTVIQGPPQIQADLSPPFQQVPAGVSVTYSVLATGTLPFHYQWFRNTSTLISGATSSSYTFQALAGSNTYFVTITNNYGSITSSVVTLVGLTNPPPVITFNTSGTGWTINSNNLNNPNINNNVLSLTDGNNSEAVSAFYNTPQYIGGFAAFFTYQEANGTAPLADGATFCVQNAPSGPAALGQGGGQLGYGTDNPPRTITPSAALELNIYNGANGGIGIQFGTNGVTADSATGPTPPYFPTSPVNLASGNPINVRLYYNQGAFYLLLVDATTGQSYTTTYGMADLPGVVGGASAYVGFTGACGGLNAIQTVTNFRFSYTTPPVLAVSRSGGNAVVTWPVSVATLFVLQQSPSLAGPWTTVGTAPTIVNGQNQVSLPLSGGQQFFRLALQ